MRFAIYSCEGTSLSLAARIQDEGNEVLYYVAPRRQRLIGRGIVPRTDSYEQLVSWAMDEQSVIVFDGSGEGKRADELRRRGLAVLGGGSFCDRLEKERAWSSKLAALHGIRTPTTHEFSTLTQAIDWLGEHPGAYVFKSNVYLDASSTYIARDAERMVRYLESARERWHDRVSCILQEKVEGIAFSTAAWWTGSGFCPQFEATIEHKAFMNDDVGPHTGCSLNLVWFYSDTPRIVKELQFDELAQTFRRLDAPPGIYDINAMLAEDGGLPYYLEWTPRFGYDSEPTGLRGLRGELSEFFYNLAHGTVEQAPFDDQLHMSVRVTLSPYAFEATDDTPIQKTCIGTRIGDVDGLWDGTFVAYGVGRNEHDELVAADPNGIIGLSAASGYEPEKIDKTIYDALLDMDIPNRQYRTDLLKRLDRDIKGIKRLGYEVPKWSISAE